jgi:hypothetical protein
VFGGRDPPFPANIPFDKPPAPLPFYRTDLHKYAFINAPEMIINDRCKMV